MHLLPIRGASGRGGGRGGTTAAASARRQLRSSVGAREPWSPAGAADPRGVAAPTVAPCAREQQGPSTFESPDERGNVRGADDLPERGRPERFHGYGRRVSAVARPTRRLVRRRRRSAAGATGPRTPRLQHRRVPNARPEPSSSRAWREGSTGPSGASALDPARPWCDRWRRGPECPRRRPGSRATETERSEPGRRRVRRSQPEGRRRSGRLAPRGHRADARRATARHGPPGGSEEVVDGSA
jgi:hypothetical protein